MAGAESGTDARAWNEPDVVATQLAPIVGSARVPRLIRVAGHRAARSCAPSWLADAIREASDVADPVA